MSIGLLGSGFEGLSAAAPAEQLRAFVSTKSCFFLENWCTFSYERLLIAALCILYPHRKKGNLLKINFKCIVITRIAWANKHIFIQNEAVHSSFYENLGNGYGHAYRACFYKFWYKWVTIRTVLNQGLWNTGECSNHCSNLHLLLANVFTAFGYNEWQLEAVLKLQTFSKHLLIFFFFFTKCFHM